MAEAIIRMDQIEIHMKSEIFSEKFLKLVHLIERYNDNYKNNNPIIPKSYPNIQFPLIYDLREKEPPPPDIEKEILQLSDYDLIMKARKYLALANQTGIEKFYRKKIKLSHILNDNQTTIIDKSVRKEVLVNLK
jgi:hypothetical protein